MDVKNGRLSLEIQGKKMIFNVNKSQSAPLKCNSILRVDASQKPNVLPTEPTAAPEDEFDAPKKSGITKKKKKKWWRLRPAPPDASRGGSKNLSRPSLP